MTPDYSAMLAHLVDLAGRPGWKSYAWHRAQQLDADESGMWMGISAALVEEMRKNMEGK